MEESNVNGPNIALIYFIYIYFIPIFSFVIIFNDSFHVFSIDEIKYTLKVNYVIVWKYTEEIKKTIL